MSEAKQGNPDACASSKAILSPSYKDGIANTSMAAYSRRVSRREPKKWTLYREDHDKRQDRDKKAPNQCHRPKRDALPKAAAFNGGHDLGG